MKRLLLAAAATLIAMPTAAFSQIVLNSGYDHAASGPYAIGARDNYWIKIASYEPPAPAAPVAPAFVYATFAYWAPELATSTTPSFPSRWIGAMPTSNGPAGASRITPAYSIFRKCFCLLAGFQNPQLSFEIRADDNVQVWLNSVTTTLVGPVAGNYASPPRSGRANNPEQFRVGRNCLYVLVEELGGTMGFNLAGTMSAFGLMPVPATGTNATFLPCDCPQPASAALTGGNTNARAASLDDDGAVIEAIVRIAEARRARALALRMETPQSRQTLRTAGYGGLPGRRGQPAGE